MRNHGIIGDLITITLNARINLIRHILLVDITLGLSCTDESYNFKDETVVNSSVSKLDGVEVNNHVAVFRSELHRERSVPLTLLIWHIPLDPVVRGDTKLWNKTLRLLMPVQDWHSVVRGIDPRYLGDPETPCYD